MLGHILKSLSDSVSNHLLKGYLLNMSNQSPYIIGLYSNVNAEKASIFLTHWKNTAWIHVLKHAWFSEDIYLYLEK